MPGWIKHKPEPRFPGEITITSDMQIITTLMVESTPIHKANANKYERGN